MTGSLDESHYDVVRAEHESDQSQLSAFSEEDTPTTIAVVRLPRDTNIEGYCDEWMSSLGMPERHLKRFWSYRTGFRTNSAVENPTQRAYEEADLDHWYRRHIQTSDEAQAAISGLVSRLENGEDITLVCFEDDSEPCHRHILIDLIEARLSSDFDFSDEKMRDNALTAEN